LSTTSIIAHLLSAPPDAIVSGWQPMDGVAFDLFTRRLVEWARNSDDVIGVVALGSTAATTRPPDRYSDHDVFVVTVDGAAQALRDDVSWLPDADRIALCHADTEHGRGVVYDDGHLVEMAVFELGELHVVRVNAYRVLYDAADIAARLVGLASSTTDWAGGVDADGSARFAGFVEQIIVGVSRHARGERLSANERIRGQALTHVLGLIRDFVPTERASAADNLDPHRRFEQTHPALGERLGDALEWPLADLAELLVAIVEQEVAPRLTIETERPLGAVRLVLDDYATVASSARRRAQRTTAM
jgi:hypothetical protein